MAAELPNLSDRQIRVYTGPTRDPELILAPIQTPAQLAREGCARPPARGRSRAGRRDPAPEGRPTRRRARRHLRGRPGPVSPSASRSRSAPESCDLGRSGLYVATPALLGYLGIDPATVDPSADFLADPTVPTDELVILTSGRGRGSPSRTSRGSTAGKSSAPGRGTPAACPYSFVTLDGLRRHGWKQIPAGWLVESSRPLTSEQIAAARELAAEAGLDDRDTARAHSLATPIAIATAAGALLALAILAMTVGLIRSESAGDLRTLTATGATGRIRRTLTAATAGALALLGALLGVAGAYVALAATYHDDLGYLGRIPLLPLVLIVVGVPLAATAAGWLLAGREPPAIARTASNEPGAGGFVQQGRRSTGAAMARRSAFNESQVAALHGGLLPEHGSLAAAAPPVVRVGHGPQGWTSGWPRRLGSPSRRSAQGWLEAPARGPCRLSCERSRTRALRGWHWSISSSSRGGASLPCTSSMLPPSWR